MPAHPVHEEDLAIADRVAALPDRKRAAAAVALTCEAPVASVDGNDGTGAADGLPIERENGLEERRPARKVAALGEPLRQRLRRVVDDRRVDDQVGRRLHPTP
jgi:hypothetical protein